MGVDHKTQKEGIRRRAPFFRPKLWAAALGCGVIVLFCLVQLRNYYYYYYYCSSSVVIVVGGLLVWLAMASAAAVVVAAAVVTWITVVVLLAFIGRPRRRLVAEGIRISKEIMIGLLVKVLLKEGNVLAALCAAVFGCLALAWGPPLLPTANYFS